MDYEDVNEEESRVEQQLSTHSNSNQIFIQCQQTSCATKYPGHVISLSQRDSSNKELNSRGGLASSAESKLIWDTEGTETLEQLQEWTSHRQRVIDGMSNPHMITSTSIFPDVHSEFVNILGRPQLHILEKEFLLSDFDQDGKLSSQEIKYWMEKHRQPISERQLKTILSSYDLDRDGKLSFREFLHLFQNIQSQSVVDKDKDKEIHQIDGNNEFLENWTESPIHPEFIQNKALIDHKRRDNEIVIEREIERKKHEHKTNEHISNSPGQISKHTKQKSHLIDETPVSSSSVPNSTNKVTAPHSTSRYRGKVKETVKLFETRIAETTKEVEKAIVQGEDLRERKIQNSHPHGWKNVTRKQIIIRRTGEACVEMKVKSTTEKPSSNTSHHHHQQIEGSKLNLVQEEEEKDYQIPPPPPLPPISSNTTSIKSKGKILDSKDWLSKVKSSNSTGLNDVLPVELQEEGVHTKYSHSHINKSPVTVPSDAISFQNEQEIDVLKVPVESNARSTSSNNSQNSDNSVDDDNDEEILPD